MPAAANPPGPPTLLTCLPLLSSSGFAPNLDRLPFLSSTFSRATARLPAFASLPYGPRGRTRLMACARSRNLKTAQLLLLAVGGPSGAAAWDSPPGGSSHLATCALLEALDGPSCPPSVAMVELLLKNGASVNGRNEDGATLLVVACQQRRQRAIAALLARGADVNAADVYGSTPLIWAVGKGLGEVAANLIRSGASPSAADNHGNTPLHWAAEAGLDDIIKTLLASRGVDRNARNADGQTPAHRISSRAAEPEAVAKGLFDMFGLLSLHTLMQGKVDLVATDAEGCTPLHRSLEVSDELSALELIGRLGPAACAAADKRGRTPLGIACNRGLVRPALLLLDGGVDATPEHPGGAWRATTDPASRALLLEAFSVNRESPHSLGGPSRNMPLWRGDKKGTVPPPAGLIALFGALADVMVGHAPRGLPHEGGAVGEEGGLARAAAASAAAARPGAAATGVPGGPGSTRGGGLMSRATILGYMALRLTLSELPQPALMLVAKGGADVVTPVAFVEEGGSNTILLEACRLNFDLLALAAAERGADVNAVDLEGRSAIRLASYFSSFNLISFLVGKGANPNAATDELTGDTPLLVACRANHDRAVRSLLAAGADPSAANKKGYTPLIQALMRHNYELAVAIINAGANCDPPVTHDGWTPIQCALFSMNEPVSLLLLERGASPGKGKMRGAAPIHMAVRANFPKVVRKLIDMGADVNAPDMDGDRPYGYAMSVGMKGIAKMIAEAGGR
jgi:ankyrin repeat protein